MSQWQPIETAPKDGTPILVWGVFAGEIGGPAVHAEVGIARWARGTTDYPGFDMEAMNTDAYAGWWKATHWQPLPEPPK